MAGPLRGGAPSLQYGVLGRVLPTPALIAVLFGVTCRTSAVACAIQDQTL